MKIENLRAVSPLDGRYASKVASLRDIVSEYGLIRYRILVEVRWLEWLAQSDLPDRPVLSKTALSALNRLATQFDDAHALRVKEIEATTNHDVKACEYLLQEVLREQEADAAIPFIHFGCTSEDINNLAYALMLRDARKRVLQPSLGALQSELAELAHQHVATPMLSRTHGQTASPTTLGKELANTLIRLHRERQAFQSVDILGKFNGAVGNFNAHVAAYPDIDWPKVSKRFVRSLGLTPNPFTTQIEPHDWIAEYAHTLIRIATVLSDYAKDTWSYISVGYFRQRTVEGEVGSSTMPHKVNPIDFENAEGNLGLASALLQHLANKLPISRWQRDLTDSTVLRNLGTALGYLEIAVASLRKGISKLEVDVQKLDADLNDSPEVLAEAIQTVMRRHGIADAYERLKSLTRGERLTLASIQTFVGELDLPEPVKANLLQMTPQRYTGTAEALAVKALECLQQTDADSP
ncbi:MAG: adenylosuccinate lyase [Pseudomonadota bacterium]